MGITAAETTGKCTEGIGRPEPLSLRIPIPIITVPVITTPVILTSVLPASTVPVLPRCWPLSGKTNLLPSESYNWLGIFAISHGFC